MPSRTPSPTSQLSPHSASAYPDASFDYPGASSPLEEGRIPVAGDDDDDDEEMLEAEGETMEEPSMGYGGASSVEESGRRRPRRAAAVAAEASMRSS